MDNDTKRKPGRPPGTHPPKKYTARLGIYLTPAQVTKLRALASEAGVSVSALVRSTLDL